MFDPYAHSAQRFECLRVGVRARLLDMAQELLVDWPHQFANIARDSRVSSSYLVDYRHWTPYWLHEPLRALLARPGVVWILGARLPVDHVATVSARIEAPAEDVWRAITDLEHLPEWRSGVVSVEMGHTPDGRPTWVETDGTGEQVAYEVISLRFPSYAVRHPRHVCWLNHTMREYYDLWPAFRSQLSGLNQKKEAVRRQLIHRADRYLLGRNVTKLFVQSETIRRRLSDWPEVRAEVLYPPPPPRPYRVDDYEPYLFAVSRFTRLKRMSLIVDARKPRET